VVGGGFEDSDDKFKKVREVKARQRKMKMGCGVAVCVLLLFVYFIVKVMHGSVTAEDYKPLPIEEDEVWTVVQGAYLAEGDDLGEIYRDDLDACRDACDLEPLCAGITLYEKSGICQLKSTQRLETGDDWHSEIKSHYIAHLVDDWIEVPDSYISAGSDVTQITFSSQTECRKACKKDHRCKAITLNEETGECFLKNAIDIHRHENWHTEVKDTFKPLLERATKKFK
jgi:hypothetical protein